MAGGTLRSAARVITSHLPTASSGRACGGLAVSKISFQARSRSRTETGTTTAVEVGWSAVLMRSGGWFECDHAWMDVPPIRTARFELVSMSVRFMRLLQVRDLEGAAAEIGASVPPDLPDRLDNFLQFRIADLEVDPSAQPWLGRAIVLTQADGSRRVIGSAGFHSPPDAEGRVEIGYKVEPSYRRQGVATEAVRALFDWAAREHGVERFRAAVAPDNVASLAIVGQLGFRQTGVQIDDIDGEELVFELDGWDIAP